jgi:hypothetical protein
MRTSLDYKTLKNNSRSLNLRGERNGMWKGREVSYRGLHHWIERNIPKPEKCQDCGLVKRLEACNISGEYLRDTEDWEYLCRSCHMKKDGRMNNLKQYQGVDQ